MANEAGKLWCPCEWADEIMPSLQSSPDRFVDRIDGQWKLIPPADSGDREIDWYCRDLEDGQVVEFMWHEGYGSRILTVNVDRTFSLDREIPDNTTHVCLAGDFDALAGSLGELVASGDLGMPLEAGEYEILAYFWSDGVPFRFDAASGVFRLSPGSN
ncbi:hypothetical protein LB566_23405 [Mesorhizobium sp. CA13]|uniref:hypothetical protein n=1 Tax=Mesorhizobium sp. CA13 TaxID=2876643 RepID=UPI001CCD0D6C|nr:hypothetical protein [Mesorhizobium sp. CA13]MBZ9856743.1 hypothetical protein [Mesorhizobium sp. CA13]